MKYRLTLAIVQLVGIFSGEVFAALPSSVYEDQNFLNAMNCSKVLEEGVCLKKGYQRTNVPVPNQGNTVVWVVFEDQLIREVNDKGKTITLDFTINLAWGDPGIKVNFSDEQRNDPMQRGIGLDLKWAFSAIWKPDLFIDNLSEYIFTWNDQIHQGALIIFYTSPEMRALIRVENTVYWKFKANAKIYCNFDLSYYPLDNQTCEFRLGSQSPNYQIALFPHKPFQQINSYETGDYEVDVTPFQRNLTHSSFGFGSWRLGFSIEMRRKIMHFVLRYYLPCIAIVLTSQVSFAIPLSAIPGRVALVVTQFLTLTNIFIHQMVRTKSFSCHINIVLLQYNVA